MSSKEQRFAQSQSRVGQGVASLAVLVITLAGCSGSPGSNDAGTTPTTPVTVSVPPSGQEQSVQIPQGSGPVTGTISVPPITVLGGGTGNLTLSVLSGTNVAFEQAVPLRGRESSIRQRGSDATLPGSGYIFEMTLTAPFSFTLPSVPGFTLNLGSVGVPNGSYVVVAVVGTAPVYYFPVTAQNDTLTFPGESEPISVTAGETLTVGLTLASNVTIPQPDAGVNPDAGPAAVFVVDSTGSLYAFDAEGNVRQKVTLPGTVGDLNGGEVALANGNVYVTLGQPTNSVVAYAQNDLLRVTLPNGAFSGLSVPRGIVFDSNNLEFYIGNGATTVTAYDASGNSLPNPPSFNAYGPSGVAYDSVDHTLWVANDGPAPYGIDEYNENGSNTVTIDVATQFVSPNTHTVGYSIAYCPGACVIGTIFVGFIPDNSGLGTAVIGSYELDGGYVSSLPVVTKPYQLSFDSQTFLWVADKGGLTKLGLSTGNVIPAAFGVALTPPIYGVAAL
jgi:hypothetical protein